MTSMTFRSIKDIEMNISLFDDKLRLARMQIDDCKIEDSIKNISMFTADSKSTMIDRPSPAAIHVVSKQAYDIDTGRYMAFMNNQVTMHYT